MKFHDLHHAFPNRVGSMSMRGRFYDWEKVHDGALAIIANGIFEDPINPCSRESIVGEAVLEEVPSPKAKGGWGALKKAVVEEKQFSTKRTSDKLNKLQAKRASHHPGVLAKAAAAANPA
jgi:hypothetical protein